MSFLINDIPGHPVVERFVDLSFEVSERILRILEQKGMTQRELAIKLDKKDSEISKWLTGNHNFTLRTIAAIETALGEKFVRVEGLEEASYTLPGGIEQVAVMVASGDPSDVVYLAHHTSTNLFKTIREAEKTVRQPYTQPFSFSGSPS
jgi:transcriptional regulator with XRE-family HTH domain